MALSSFFSVFAFIALSACATSSTHAKGVFSARDLDEKLIKFLETHIWDSAQALKILGQPTSIEDFDQTTVWTYEAGVDSILTTVPHVVFSFNRSTKSLEDILKFNQEPSDPQKVLSFLRDVDPQLQNSKWVAVKKSNKNSYNRLYSGKYTDIEMNINSRNGSVVSLNISPKSQKEERHLSSELKD